jgi:hypothetical protein
MWHTFFDVAFAGLGSMLLHLGIAAAGILLCVLGAIFSPVGKLDFVVAAVVISLLLGAESMGINLERKHVEAQQAAIQNAATAAVAKTQTPKAKKASDPWDRKEY